MYERVRGGGTTILAMQFKIYFLISLKLKAYRGSKQIAELHFDVDDLKPKMGKIKS